MSIVANALQGNCSIIPFLKIVDSKGKTIFFGREDGIWTNKKLLNTECVITSGYDYFICNLINETEIKS